LEISSPSTSIVIARSLVASGSASSKAVRNWLETSPRTRTGSCADSGPGRPLPMRSGG